MKNEKQYYLISLLLLIIGILLLFLSPWFLLLNIILWGIGLIIFPPINKLIKTTGLKRSSTVNSPKHNIIDSFTAVSIKTTGRNIETDTIVSYDAIHYRHGLPTNAFMLSVKDVSLENREEALIDLQDFIKNDLWVSFNMPLTNAFLAKEGELFNLDFKSENGLCSLTYSQDDVLCQEFEFTDTEQFTSGKEEAVAVAKHFQNIQEDK